MIPLSSTHPHQNGQYQILVPQHGRVHDLQVEQQFMFQNSNVICVSKRKIHSKRTLTLAIKWDGAESIFPMERDPYVCSPKVDLSEGQSSHITPVLKGRADSRPGGSLRHVGGVAIDAVRQTLLTPTTCKKRVKSGHQASPTKCEMTYLHYDSIHELCYESIHG